MCILVDGAWSDWEQWERCSLSCGYGTKERKRICNNPSPQFDGKICSGTNFESETCKEAPCPSKVHFSYRLCIFIFITYI